MFKKKNIKASVDDDGNLHFWEDGINERDWLVLLTSAVFFGSIFIGVTISILSMFMDIELPPVYIELIKTMDIPITTIVGGIFANKVAQTIVTKKDTDNVSNSVEINTNMESDI